MICKYLTGAAVAALTIAAPVFAETVAITGGTVWTGTQDAAIEDGVVLIVDDKIVAVGDSRLSVPSNATVIDADGGWITPGIFVPFARTGLVEVGAEATTNDTSADESKYSAALNAADSFNPSATAIDVTRIEGVTRLAVAPANGNSIFAGRGFVADTSGEADSITQENVFQLLSLGESGAGISGGSRSAAWATLRAAIDDSQNFTSRYITTPNGAALNRVDAEALAPAARGQQLLLVRIHRASDIRRLIGMLSDYPELDVAIVGATEGWIVAEELAEAGIPVIIDPFDNLPASFEQLGATSHNAERLIEAGVMTAFAHLGNDAHQSRLVLQSAGNAVANGVSRADAMRAITSIPADIFGQSDLGRLNSGAIADLVVWDGDPLEVTSAPTHVLIDGKQQSMESRQTLLRDRYLSLEDGDLPLAYRK